MFCPQCKKDAPNDKRLCRNCNAVVDDLLETVLDDNYRVDARLGQGGMGRVYRAWSMALETDVVIKV